MKYIVIVKTSAMFSYITIIATICLLTNKAYGDTNYRLNTTLVPSSYSLVITPYFDTGDDTAFTFDGEVTITFTTESNVNQIKLHSQDLEFRASNITVTSGSLVLMLDADNPLEFNETYSFVYINLQSELQVGVEYNLNIVYRGPIRSDLNGFYRNSYVEQGVTKWLGATQMEPTHARKAFPCFDEPALKATFYLTIDRPAHYQPTLANTRLQSSIALSNGYIRETFYPTPVMSTYLVAFLVSEFEAALNTTINTREFGVYTRPEAASQAEYAFDFGVRVVQALGDYFGIDYYSTDSNLKLDHVALPDFRAGAMENWGLIKYREGLLLYVPDISPPYYRYRVAQIVAHETTHMWFGNLVTCHWWSNIWLNEGFANYFQDYITSLIEPEVGSADVLVTGSVYQAYSADESRNSPALTNDNVNSPAEISGHFGTITYQKGGSVIRMIHHLIGDDAFRYALNAYLTENQFSVGHPDELYRALRQGVTATDGLYDHPGLDVADVMSTWVAQAGHPMLEVSVDYEDETVTLNQKRFYANSNIESDELYAIPISYTTEVSPDFSNTRPLFVMENRTYVLNVPNISQNRSWVLFNIQETGFYRVNYDDESWHIIADALKGENREQIHHLNRAKIVNDLFAFLYADEEDFDLLYEVLEFLTDESDYSVWFAAIRGLNRLRTSYLGTNVLNDIENYARRLLEGVINRIGYDITPTDDFVTLRNRVQILEFACRIGHQGCIDNAVSLFRRLRENGTEVPPSLKTVVYCNGLRYGNSDDFDFLWNRMTTTNVANEMQIILDALGCSSVEERLNYYLASILEENSPIRAQDLTVPLTSVLANYSHLHIVLEGLQENFTLWSTVYPSMQTVLNTVAAALHTDDEFEQFDNWLSTCSQCGEQTVTAARNAVAQARASAAWAEDHTDDVLSTLRSFALQPTPVYLILVISVMTSLSLGFS